MPPHQVLVYHCDKGDSSSLVFPMVHAVSFKRVVCFVLKEIDIVYPTTNDKTVVSA